MASPLLVSPPITPLSSADQTLAFPVALARFEYEAGCTNSNQATKVLMVEWEDTSRTRGIEGTWHIDWKDRHAVLPAQKADASSDQTQASTFANDIPIHRFYFLLPAGTSVPPLITIRFESAAASPHTATSAPESWTVQPLPAIFPPALTDTAHTSGKKGVLHTLWAKRRLRTLKSEIAHEETQNIEGIGLEMAMQEKDWILENFGIDEEKASDKDNTGPTTTNVHKMHLPFDSQPALSPSTPRSPGGGRLLEKMKGLRVGTNEKDWTNRHHMGIDTPPQTDSASQHPLSPDQSDVAVSSFAAIKGAAARSTAMSERKPMHVIQPPPNIIAAQQQGQGSTVSLASMDSIAFAPTSTSSNVDLNDDDDDGDDLFALPMSPRSPDMTKSPFSFDARDTEKYNIIPI